MSRLFDGVNDYLTNSTNPMTNTTDFTMGGWFKKVANPSGGSIAVLFQNGHNGGSGSGYEIRMYDDGSIAIDIGFVAGWTTSTIMNTTDWYSIIMRRYDSRLYAWINGVQDAGGSEFATPFTPLNGVWIGSSNDSGTPERFFNGYAAECFMYTRPLDVAEIQALAKGYSPLFMRNGLAFYVPLIGNASPEPNRVSAGQTMTVSGAVKGNDHPRIIYPGGTILAPFGAPAATNVTVSPSVLALLSVLNVPTVTAIQNTTVSAGVATMTLILNTPTVISELIGWVLNDQNIPRPKGFTREKIQVKKDFRTISGRTVRDITATKEKFILDYEIMSQSEIQALYSIVELNAPVSFFIDDGNLQIGERTVIPTITTRLYETPGGDYIEGVSIELVDETA